MKRSIWLALVGTTILLACSSGSASNDTASNDSLGASCESASDCAGLVGFEVGLSGLLPEGTEQCADGTSESAQWACTSGQCAVSYCDSHGGVGGATSAEAGTSDGEAGAASTEGGSEGDAGSEGDSDGGSTVSDGGSPDDGGGGGD
jgi:hypothetical protein